MVSVSVSEIFGIEKSIDIGFGKSIGFEKFGIAFENFWYRKSISFEKFGIEKVSDSENTFEETRNPLKNIKGWRCLFLPMTGNPLKNIKGWWCLFLPIRKSSQKYQGVAVLFSADDRKSSKKYQGVAVLVGKKGRQFRS